MSEQHNTPEFETADEAPLGVGKHVAESAAEEGEYTDTDGVSHTSSEEKGSYVDTATNVEESDERGEYTDADR